MPGTRPLWPSLDLVARRLRAADGLVVATDFDGTLADLRGHPRRVVMSARTRAALERLARQPDVRVAVLSGRSLDDLRRHVRIRGAFMSGLAGFETRAPGGRLERHAPPGARPPAELRERLAEWCRRFAGAWVEDKGAILAVHHRSVAPARWAAFRAGVARRLRPHAARTRLLTGRAVLELLPRLDRDKAVALREWLGRTPGVRIVSLGDDANDEPMHAYVRRSHGISVAVNRPRTGAEFGVRSSAEVPRFLEWLLDAWRSREATGGRESGTAAGVRGRLRRGAR